MQAAKTISTVVSGSTDIGVKKILEILAQNTEGIFACSSSKTMSVVVDSLVCICFYLVMRIRSHQRSCQLESLVSQNYVR